MVNVNCRILQSSIFLLQREEKGQLQLLNDKQKMIIMNTVFIFVELSGVSGPVIIFYDTDVT